MLTDDEIKAAEPVYSAGDFSNMQNAWMEALERELALQARVKVLEDALQAAADSMTCKGNGHDAAHYCPNCDSNMYGPRDRARTALQEQSK
jgi:hypothetical protein